jgi:hypothetical protein
MKRIRKKIRKRIKEYREKLDHWWIMEGGPWLDYFGPYRFLRTKYYNIKYGIKNLFVWLPTIWGDRDWDEYFLLRILELKFKRMEHLFREHGNHVGADRTAHRLRICRCLCKRLAEEKYTTPYDERNKPHLDWVGKKIEESFHKEPNENGFITIIGHNEPDEPEDRWIRPRHEHEEKMIQQDIDLLCKIIQRHVRGWWD